MWFIPTTSIYVFYYHWSIVIEFSATELSLIVSSLFWCFPANYDPVSESLNADDHYDISDDVFGLASFGYFLFRELLLLLINDELVLSFVESLFIITIIKFSIIIVVVMITLLNLLMSICFSSYVHVMCLLTIVTCFSLSVVMHFLLSVMVLFAFFDGNIIFLFDSDMLFVLQGKIILPLL